MSPYKQHTSSHSISSQPIDSDWKVKGKSPLASTKTGAASKIETSSNKKQANEQSKYYMQYQKACKANYASNNDILQGDDLQYEIDRQI